jgi:hypothetical protein
MDAGFLSPAPIAGQAVAVVISAYNAARTEPLVLGTDYDFYCYAQDDVCLGCQMANAVNFSAVLATRTPTRTLDITPPQLRVMRREAIAHDRIFLALRVDEGARIWCTAWTKQPANFSVNYEAQIKAESYRCQDDRSTPCGGFWIYDLDDLEDSADDGVGNQSDYDHPALWKSGADVNIILTGLTEATTYNHIYCFAEDDEVDGIGSMPNGMPLLSGPMNDSNVEAVRHAIGPVTTLDETPPTFTRLQLQDPTARDDRLVVTFALNEPGTAYCRAVRSDSGETAVDVPINRVIGANWSLAYNGSYTSATLEITGLENVVPSLTVRNDEVGPISQGTQYDVYCWARDNAVDNYGWDRPNNQNQTYASTDAGNPMAPNGGVTAMSGF